jgi:hypothetical protein
MYLAKKDILRCQLFPQRNNQRAGEKLPSKFNVKGVSHLLVDCFFVGKADTSECLSSLNTFLSLADSLGIPITAEKTGPSRYNDSTGKIQQSQ